MTVLKFAVGRKTKSLKHPVSFTDTPLMVILEGNKKQRLNSSPLKWSPPLKHLEENKKHY
jgi:hypothetical protein